MKMTTDQNLKAEDFSDNNPVTSAEKPGVDLGNESQTPEKKKGGRRIFALVILIILLILSGYQSYRSYFANPRSEEKIIEIVENSAPLMPETAAPTTTNSTAEKKSTSNSSATNKTVPTATTTAPSTSNPTPATAASEKEKIIEYFIDIALAYQGVERWTKNPFNIGYAPNALDRDLETCLDGFIRDFNNASSTVKMQKNRELADIKVYVVSPEQMIRYGGDDAGRGFAYIYKNANNEDYKAEIFLSNSLPDNQKSKCYLMKHEIMHTVGFHGHSDLFWEGIMAVPSEGRNTENIMSKVDTMAIKMLYNTGLPLKATEAETRAYLNAHYPE